MDATSSSTQPPTCPHAAATKSSLDDDDNKNKINNNCDSSNTANNNSNRHSSVNGSAGKRTTPQEDSVTTTTTTNKANGDAFAMCAHAKTQSITNANEEQQQVPAPRIVTREVCDHVQFLITEIQKPRDGNEDSTDEARLENEERQRKTTDGTLGEEPDDWPTGM